jgi:hypothetical protein
MANVQMIVTGVFEVSVPEGLSGEDLEEAALDAFAEQIPCSEMKQLFSVTES